MGSRNRVRQRGRTRVRAWKQSSACATGQGTSCSSLRIRLGNRCSRWANRNVPRHNSRCCRRRAVSAKSRWANLSIYSHHSRPYRCSTWSRCGPPCAHSCATTAVIKRIHEVAEELQDSQDDEVSFVALLTAIAHLRFAALSLTGYSSSCTLRVVWPHTGSHRSRVGLSSGWRAGEITTISATVANMLKRCGWPHLS